MITVIVAVIAFVLGLAVEGVASLAARRRHFKSGQQDVINRVLLSKNNEHWAVAHDVVFEIEEERKKAEKFPGPPDEWPKPKKMETKS